MPLAHHSVSHIPTHHHSKKSAVRGTASAALEIGAWLQIPRTVNKTLALLLTQPCSRKLSQKRRGEEQSIVSLNRRCPWQGGSTQPLQWTAGLCLRRPGEPDWSACPRCMQTSYLPSRSLLPHAPHRTESRWKWGSGLQNTSKGLVTADGSSWIQIL